MKKEITTILLLLCGGLFCLPSCKDKSNGNPAPLPTIVDSSIWIVNSERFVVYDYNTRVNGSTNRVTMRGSEGVKNSFSLTFNRPYLPASGNFVLNCSGQGLNNACLEITFSGVRYKAKTDPSVYLHADTDNHYAVYTFGPDWFYSTLRPHQDSVTISGVLKQPQH